MAVTVGDCPTIVADIQHLSGDIIANSRTFSPLNNDVTVELQCMPGYTLLGNRVLTCANGTWSDEPPICVKLQQQDDTATTAVGPLTTGDGIQHGGRDYGRLTSHEMILIVGSCVTCLVVIVTFFAMIGVAKCVRQRRLRTKQRLAANVKLPLGVASSSSGASPSYDNQSFMYENVGSTVAGDVTNSNNSRGLPSSLETQHDQLGHNESIVVVDNDSDVSVSDTNKSCHFTATRGSNLQPEAQLIVPVNPVTWTVDKMAWHDEFDYSRVKLPRPRLVTASDPPAILSI